MKPTAKEVMRQAILLNGYKETGNNHTKMGKAYGKDGVSWCAIYEWYCGWIAAGKDQKKNPIAKADNAADIQDLTVSQKDGKWLMKKTGSRDTKKKGLGKVEFGAQVSFDFGVNDLWRDHTAFAIGRIGNDYVTIEGNTSPEGRSGSQSNGDQVAIRYRHYSLVCSMDMPAYGKEEKYVIKTPFDGVVPTLPKRGYFDVGNKGKNVKRLQKALNWSVNAEIKVDGVFGNETLFGVYWYQVQLGLTPDGDFGKVCLKKLKQLVKKHAVQTNAEKIVEMANKCAWPYGTPKSKFAYPDGKPKDAYKKALNEAYPDRSKWGVQTRAGASCDVAVGVVMRASGVDKNWPRGLDEVEPYIAKNKDKYKTVNNPKYEDLKPGDVIYELYNGGGGHISIFTKDHRLYQAQHNGKAYPHIVKYEDQIHGSHKKFCVYRIKE